MKFIEQTFILFCGNCHRFRLGQVLTILIFGFSDNAIANSLNGYCISQTKPEVKVEETSSNYDYALSIDDAANIIFDKEGYILTRTIGIGELKLIRKQDNQIVSKLSTSFLEKDEWVTSLVGTQSKWFVIHADKNNYVSHFRYQKDLRGESKIIFVPPVAIDGIYQEKCNSWRKYWDTCNASYPYYSETLNRVFISGYSQKDRGHQWVTTEIIQGKAETLLPSKKIKNYLGDIPSLNGVLLRGHKGEVFFYDGIQTTKLSRQIRSIEQDIPSLNGALLQGTKGEVLFYDGKTIVELSKEFPFNKDGRSWHVIKPKTITNLKNIFSDERIFLANFIGNNKRPKLFIELNKDLSLTPISFPQEVMKGNILVFALPSDLPIWIAVLKQKSTPNKAQASFISGE